MEGFPAKEPYRWTAFQYFQFVLKTGRPRGAKGMPMADLQVIASHFSGWLTFEVLKEQSVGLERIKTLISLKSLTG